MAAASAITNAEVAERTAGQTVPRRFLATVRERPHGVALRWKDGDDWVELTWAQYADQAARVAAGLTRLGIGVGDRVVLLMRNRPEFHIADMGAMLAGATPISIYNSSAPEQIQYLAGHCHANVAIIEDVEYLERVLKVRGELPDLRETVLIEDRDGVAPDDVLRWSDLIAGDPVDLDAAARIAQPDHLATVIYTSGTTGPPKGVMLDHANIVWTIESLRLALADVATVGRRLVSYLPMAHIAERMTSHYQAAALGYEVTTCPEAGRVASSLPDVRPEIFFAVPRVWEKIHAGVYSMLAGNPEQQEGFERALAVGAKVDELRTRGEEPLADLAVAYEEAESTALRLVRELLGLDQVVTAVSGAAPITREVLGFFRALGVPLSEIYGMSESSGPITWEPFRVKIGTVGPAIAGCEVKLAEDGEVVFRGGNVFRGYLDDTAKTSEALDADGWMHTGDIGEFDDDGYLKIVDRKKELIVTAGGKNISPANLEAALKSFPLIGQACVIGDSRPFISALLVLDPEAAPAWAKKNGVEETDPEALAANPAVLVEVGRNVAEVNQRFSQVEQIKKFHLLGEEWQADSEEMTPTMKLKRRGIHAKYAEEIDALYVRR